MSRIFEDEEFLAYRDELHKFPFFTFPDAEMREKGDELLTPPKNFSMRDAKRHPARWAYLVCGVVPRDYQFMMLDYMYSYTRVAGVTSRQIGKSLSIGLFSFWAAYNNVKPTGIPKKTRIGIVSRTEDQAKKLLKDIYAVVQMADVRYSRMTEGSPHHEKSYFTSRMSEKPTQFRLEWPGGTIEIFPPTGSIRGNSFSYLMIDEADFLKAEDPDYFFNSEASPTVKATLGNIILWSTPKGTPSYFYKIIQPNLEEPAQGWKRIWLPWTCNEDEKDLANGWEERKRYIAKGDEMDFKIEYEASFLSGKHTYFSGESIDSCIDESLQEEYEWYEGVTVGLDFGDTHSRTVVTVVHNDPSTNVTQVLYVKEFEAGYNNANLPAYFKTLRNRYRIKQIVCDDCVGGKTAIELLRRDGWNLKMFQFKRDKHEYYEYLKVAFANKRIALYNLPPLIAQLKALESVETASGNIQIRKPRGGNDDMCDSLVMATSPFTPPKRAGKRFIL